MASQGGHEQTGGGEKCEKTMKNIYIYVIVIYIILYFIIYVGGEGCEEDDGEPARFFCQKSLMQIKRYCRS